MKILTLDCENTMFKHQPCKSEEGFYNSKDRIGKAFCLPQFLVMTGLKWFDKEPQYYLNLSNSSECIQHMIEQSDLVVGFNIKHDLHWLWRAGVKTPNIKVWDCQVAEWMLNHQKILGKNSLNDACERYGLPPKIDVIENEYWSKGIDTDEIPTDVLWEYLQGDLDRPERVFIEQVKRFGQEWMIKK